MSTLDFFYIINHPSIQGMYLNKVYKINGNKIIKQGRAYFGSMFDYGISRAYLFKNYRDVESTLTYFSTHKPFSSLQFTCKISTIAYSPLKNIDIVDLALAEIKEVNAVYYSHLKLKDRALEYLKMHSNETEEFHLTLVSKLKKFIKIVEHSEKTGNLDILNTIDDPSNAQSS